MYKNGVFIKKTKVPVYKTHLWIVVSDSLIRSIDAVEDQIDHRIIKDKDKGATLAYTYAYQRTDGKYHIFIFLPANVKPGTVAHEAFHATNIVYNWHGVRPSYSNDEAHAYFLDWMVDVCHTAIDQYKKKNS